MNRAIHWIKGRLMGVWKYIRSILLTFPNVFIKLPALFFGLALVLLAITWVQDRGKNHITYTNGYLDLVYYQFFDPKNFNIPMYYAVNRFILLKAKNYNFTPDTYKWPYVHYDDKTFCHQSRAGHNSIGDLPKCHFIKALRSRTECNKYLVKLGCYEVETSKIIWSNEVLQNQIVLAARSPCKFLYDPWARIVKRQPNRRLRNAPYIPKWSNPYEHHTQVWNRALCPVFNRNAPQDYEGNLFDDYKTYVTVGRDENKEVFLITKNEVKRIEQ